MGFFDFLGDITGYNQMNRGKKAEQKGMAAQEQAAGTAAGAAGTAANIGKTAAGISAKTPQQFAQESMAAGKGAGNEMGIEAARTGTQEATQAARTAGLNKGQAGIAGAQRAGGLYSQGNVAGRQMGTQAYQGGANTQLGGVNAQTGAANAQTGAAAAQGQIGSNLQQGGLGAGKQSQSGFGSILSAISDEDQKTDIKPSVNLEDVLRKIMPAKFNYKPEAGEGSGEHIGVMAQDIEKTPMKENVIETPKGKAINGPKQENSNLNLIVQLASRIKELEGKLGESE